MNVRPDRDHGLPPERWSFQKQAFEPEGRRRTAPEEAQARGDRREASNQVEVLVSQGQSAAKAVRAIGVTRFTCTGGAKSSAA